MHILLFFKPIVDMFYKYAVLDYALLAFSILCAVLSFSKIGRAYWTDLISFLILLLLTISLMNDFGGIYNYVKIASALLLYFIGRGTYKSIKKNDCAILCSHIIVLAVNFATLILRSGYTVWGHASTFRGMYFYKSDLAVAMIYVIAVILFIPVMKSFWKTILTVIAVMMLLLSNSRIAVIIAFVVFALYYLYLREKKSQSDDKVFRLTPKVLALFGLTLIAGIYAIRWIGNLPVFRQLNFISLSFDSFTDLGNASNTQGRNIVWQNIMKSFASAPIANQLFGIDLVSDTWNGYESHSSYIKMLYYTGYVGLTLFLAFFVIATKRINKMNSRNHFFFTLALLSTFLIQSVSQSGIAYTQMTWVFFYYVGLSITASFEKKQKPTYDEVRVYFRK